jgi:predicted dehydrogenase
MNILLIGRGSIGDKHLATLRSLQKKLGLSIEVWEPATHGRAYLQELTRILLDKNIQAAIICNPTSLHAQTTLACLRAGAHVFVEKPLGMSFDAGIFAQIERAAKQKKLTLMVGYDMRFNPWILKIKERMTARALGRVWGARVMAGQYLPDWRPGVDYRETYSAKKSLGGGVLLDLSHELDYLLWLMPSKARRVTARKIHTGLLQIDTEDVASLIIDFADGAVAQVQLDYLTVPYRRSLELYGEKGTLLWDDNSHTLRLYTKKDGKWRTISVAEKEATAKGIYTSELEHFFDCIKNKRIPRNSLTSSLEVMRLLSKANESAKRTKTVTI